MRWLVLVLAVSMGCSAPAGNEDGGSGGGSASGGGGGGVAAGGGVATGGGGGGATGGGAAAGGGGATGGGAATGGGSATGGGGAASTSPKRGLAYDLASSADLAAVSPGISWWYDWSATPHAPVDHGVEFVPMLWNFNFNGPNVIAYLRAHPDVHYVMVLNEPNLTDQSNQTPQQAAMQWPLYEALAADAGVQIVGPQITWGTMPNYGDPVVWMDAFIAAYKASNGGREPRIDYLGFHWYDYGLAGQLDRLTKYGKPFWVTEMANWHPQNDGAQIDTLAKQKTQMANMVQVCESRTDVFRYAWFTGRWNPDPHFTSVLADAGVRTELGDLYLSLPH